MGGRLYTRGEVSVLLGVSHSTVIRMEASGQLTTVRVGSRGVRILADSVERHLTPSAGFPGAGSPRTRGDHPVPPPDTSFDNDEAE